MRYSAAIITLAATASAKYTYGNATTSSTTDECYTSTEVVSSYETYCSSAMTYVEGSKTYSVTQPTTLTISDCPYGCTVTKTYTSANPEKTYPPSQSGYPPSHSGSPAAPQGTGSYGSTNATNSYKAPTETPLQGGSGRVTVAGGALTGLLAMVAYLL